jgi:UDP-N-acetylmuramoylalanine--D-glutamate ligase
MDLAHKKFMIVGLARTGRECARFLAAQGAQVTVTDLRAEADLKQEMDALAGLPIEYRLGGEDLAWLDGINAVVPSPGVPMDNRLLQEAVRRAVPVWSEIELAYRFLPVPLVAITGTNGKSTTTTLIGEMLKASGAKTFVGGNIGTALVSFVGGDWQCGVAEISSFQLEWVEQFHPRVAVLLNLTEDHLDRYPNFAVYCAAKERIFAAQTQDDVAVLNRDDPLVWAMRARIAARIVSFGFDAVEEGVFAEKEKIVWRGGGREEVFPTAKAKIQGVHNIENMMAAIAAAKAAGVERAPIQRVLESFPGLEHRLEFVRERAGVRYFNDSKGTNVGAVVKSLASFDAPVILLAGGVDKGGDYSPLDAEIKSKVRRLILFGAAKQIIANALGSLTQTVLVEDLATALRDAAAHARSGDVVLLSPACSSFDQFANYAERGRMFKELVRAL